MNYKKTKRGSYFIKHRVVSLKPAIVLIIGHFLTSAKFRKISRQYQNFAEKGKFRRSAGNSTSRGEL